MAQPYVGEIRMFGGNFSPAGWHFCDGSLLPISENEVLFQLIGTTYGGDGQTTFGVPDLRGRLPIHQGNGFIVGENGGAESVTLTTNQLPTHNHPFLASQGPGNQNNPANSLTANSSSVQIYIEDSPDTSMNAQSVGPVGGSQPHSNMQPYLCISFIISLFGIFPPPS
jgi:microcystin-dependent protein